MLEINAICDQGVKKPITFKSWWFPGGENGFVIQDGLQYLNYSYWCQIIARIQSSNDLLELMSAVYAIRSDDPNTKINLNLPYMPAARQDRISNSGEALSVKIYADIINSLNFENVQICDPHSWVTPALLDRVFLYNTQLIIKQVIDDCNPDIIISPDAGATKRIEDYLSKINYKLPIIQCLKKRDTVTGKLSGFQVICEKKQLDDKKCLILDDICDGGGTFIGLGEELDNLEDNFIGDLFLYVTHGIFSKGYKDLLNTYEKIYTTDSFIPKENPPNKVKVYKLYE